MNEEAKLMSELEHFDPVPLHVSYPAALAPRLEFEVGASREPWRVVVPDLPGCHATGDTQEEVMTNAIEAVELWTEAAVAAGREVPEPSIMDGLARQAQYAGWTWFFVGSARLTAADSERVAQAFAELPEPVPAPRVEAPAPVQDEPGGV